MILNVRSNYHTFLDLYISRIDKILCIYLSKCLFTERSIHFVEWLHKLCVDNLLPGACYQRRKGSLDLLRVIYDTLIYCPDSRQRKGFTPETARKLLEFARSCGSWEFFNVENTNSLILCLLDGADEVIYYQEINLVFLPASMVILKWLFSIW